MGLLERYLEDLRKRGLQGDIRPCSSDGVGSDGSLAVPTTGVSIKPRNQRVSLLVVNQDSSNFAKARIGGTAITASSGAGIRLDAAGGFIQIEREFQGTGVAQAVHLVADTAQVTVYVYEEEAY